LDRRQATSRLAAFRRWYTSKRRRSCSAFSPGACMLSGTRVIGLGLGQMVEAGAGRWGGGCACARFRRGAVCWRVTFRRDRARGGYLKGNTSTHDAGERNCTRLSPPLLGSIALHMFATPASGAHRTATDHGLRAGKRMHVPGTALHSISKRVLRLRCYLLKKKLAENSRMPSVRTYT